MIKVLQTESPSHSSKNSSRSSTMSQSVFVPEYDDKYTVWGHFETVLKIIKSKQFYPVWITGHSGNGKSTMVEQACAIANLPDAFLKMSQQSKLKVFDEYAKADKPFGREYIRVNFTTETDESDLIGHYTLIDGNTVYQEGPVTEALRRGAVLLLDELDMGHVNKILCLQSVLEGKGVLLKQTGEYIKPADGFTVFATSNTKGRGSDDGKYIGSSIMNGAFMDRFPAMINQEYPPSNIERQILTRYIADICDISDKSILDNKTLKMYATYVQNICKWAEGIRERFKAGDIEEVITTRTLINMVKGYYILGSQRMALEMACERYPDDINQQFRSYYEKLGFSDEDEANQATSSKDETTTSQN